MSEKFPSTMPVPENPTPEKTERIHVEPEIFEQAERKRRAEFKETPKEISKRLYEESRTAKKIEPLPLGGSEKEQIVTKAESEKIKKSLQEAGRELRERERRRLASKAGEELKGLELPTKEPAFLDFLTRYPDMGKEIGPNFAKKIQSRYEAYLAQKELSQKMESFYDRELPEKFAVNLDKDDRGTLKEAMAKIAIENPEGLKIRLAEWNHKEKQEKYIKILEKNVEELGGEEERKKAVAELEKEEKIWGQKKELADWTTGWRGFLNPKNSELLGWFFRSRIFGETKEKREYRQEIQKRAGIKWQLPFFKNIDEETTKITEEYERTKRLKRRMVSAAPEQLKRLKDAYSGWRILFLENFEGAKTLTKLAQAKVNKKINALVSKGMKKKDIGELETAQLYADLIKKGREESDIKIELKLKQGAVERKIGSRGFINLIDKKVEKLATAMIQEKIAGLDLPTASAESLYQALNKLLEKPALGAKKKSETKIFMQNALLENIKKVEDQTKKQIGKVEGELKRVQASKEKDKVNKLRSLVTERRRLEKDQQKKILLINLTVAKITGLK